MYYIRLPCQRLLHTPVTAPCNRRAQGGEAVPWGKRARRRSVPVLGGNGGSHLLVAHGVAVFRLLAGAFRVYL